MAGNLVQLDVSAQLNLLARKSQCSNVVCSRLEVPPRCGEHGLVAGESRCLVDYHYPLTLGEIAQVAREADYTSRLEESREFARQAAAEDVEKEPVAPFRPDWRFWTGVTLSGLGLFLHRNR